MKAISIMCLLLLSTATAHGEDKLKPYFESEKLYDKTMVLHKSYPGDSDPGPYTFQYMIDQKLKDLEDNASFLASGKVKIRVVGFDPLYEQLDVDNKKETEPIGDISAFKTALTDTSKSLTAAVAAPVPAPGACNALDISGIKTQLDEIATKAVDAAYLSSLDDKKNPLHGYDRVHYIVIKTTTDIDNLKTLKKNISDDIATLRKNINEPIPYCAQLHNLILDDISSKVTAAVTANTSYIKAIQDLVKKYDSKNTISYMWSDDDLILLLPEPTISKYTVTTLNFQRRQFNDPTKDKDAVFIKLVEKSKTSKTMVFRIYSPLVPEVGLSYVYSPIRYPKWGTTVVNGQTIVSAAGNDSYIGHVAVTLNLIIPHLLDNPFHIYPGVQVGVATDKDNPAFLAGGLIRIIPIPLCISGGAMFSFHKDLSTLHEGSVVTGTADLDKDLKQKAFISGYVGIQYNF